MPATDAASWSVSAEQVLDRLSGNRWVPLAANLAALVLLVYGLAHWTWRLLEPSVPAPTPMSRSADPNLAPFDLQPLIAAHLFGQAQTAPVAGMDPEHLPLSSLNVVLTGVMARGVGGFALLSINGAPEIPVVVGQEVTAGAVLEAVYADRIVLRRGTALESVLLKDSDAVLPSGSIVTGRPDPAGNVVQSLGGGVRRVDRQALGKNLTAEVLNQAAVAPGAGGLVMREVQSGSMFEALGLRAGDVVHNINGQSVNSLEDIARIYGQLGILSQNARVTVEVVRGGKSEVLEYQVQ